MIDFPLQAGVMMYFAPVTWEADIERPFEPKSWRLALALSSQNKNVRIFFLFP